MHAIAAKAVTFKEAMQPDFVRYQKAVLANARVLADELKKDGLHLVSGGTDNHLVLVDLATLGITGMDAQVALQAANIVINRNTVPFAEAVSRKLTSGMRLGTPAITTRGFGPEEMRQVAALILKILHNINDPGVRYQVKDEVGRLCNRFPIPGIDS